MTTPTQRIGTLDALRGIALLGILLMNLIWFAIPEKAVEDLGVRGEYQGANYWAWWIVEGFLHGNMRGIFSMLFGASAVLILEQYSKRYQHDGAAEFYFRRLLVLFFFGLFNAYILLWSGDILYTYAIAGMFIFPVYRLSAKRIILVASLVMLLDCMHMSWNIQKPIRLKEAADKALAIDTMLTPLTQVQKSNIIAWETFKLENTIEHKRTIDQLQIEYTQADFPTFFLYSASISHFLETIFFYDRLFPDSLTFMLYGIAFYRLGILTGQRSKRFYMLLLVAGYTVGLPIYYAVAHNKIENNFNAYLMALNQPIYYQPLGRLGITLGNIALFNLLFSMPITAWLSKLMQPIGRMAFTNYLMQSIICTLLFSGFAFNMFNKLERYQLFYVAGIIWVFQIVLSHLWMRNFSMGPFEWLWRSASKWQWQKFERIKS